MTSITLRVLAGNILFRKSMPQLLFKHQHQSAPMPLLESNREVDVQGIDRVRPENVVTKKEGF